MSEQTHVSPGDVELEALLRATFAAEASRRVPDSRLAPPFPATERLATVHPLRRRWTGVVLVAATLVGIIVGGTVIGHEAMDAKPRPVPPATSVVPAPTITSSMSVSTSPTPPSTSASTPPVVTTKQLVVDGVTLTVPETWQVTSGTPALDGTCLSVDAVVKEDGPHANNCELQVTVFAEGDGENRPDVDSPSVFGEGAGALCGTSPLVPERTVTADQVPVDGEQAEHRVFTAPCLTGTFEQWTVATSPVVMFVRQKAPADATGEAEAEALAAVESAILPGPRSALRLTDLGFVTDVSAQTLELDRVTKLYGPGGAPVLQDVNPTTYDYPVGNVPGVSYVDPATQKRVVFAPSDMVGLLDGPQVIAGVEVPALAGLQALVRTNGSQVTSIELTART